MHVCLILQREGQGGLEVCPGREASTDFGVGNDWTPVVPRNDAITINIGDLLMRWCASCPCVYPRLLCCNYEVVLCDALTKAKHSA